MDLVVILIVVLIIVLVWRGPKTLPLLGRAFGQGIREARREGNEMKGDHDPDVPGEEPRPPAV